MVIVSRRVKHGTPLRAALIPEPTSPPPRLADPGG
jgi:hypothetical protein